MRICIWLIAFASSAALAHGGHQGRNSSAAADAQTRDHASPNSELKKPVNSHQDANQAKAVDERQRFCVRNHAGRVNCVVFPSAGH